MNQETRVKKYLERGHIITSLDAREQLGIISLPKRISNLRQSGMIIKDRWKCVKNRFNEDTRIKEYYL